MADLVVRQHKDLTKEEHDKLVERAFDLERSIKAGMKKLRDDKWALTEQLYEFGELRGWELLGYESPQEWLAQPDLGYTRTEFERQVRCWRGLIVVNKLPPSALSGTEPARVAEVLPAVMAGKVRPKDAIADTLALSYSDVREKYRAKRVEDHGQEPDGSTPLDASTEPTWVTCPTCSSRVPDSAIAPDDE